MGIDYLVLAFTKFMLLRPRPAITCHRPLFINIFCMEMTKDIINWDAYTMKDIKHSSPSLSLLILVNHATCCSLIVSSSSFVFHGCSLYLKLPMVWYVVTCFIDYRHVRPTCTCTSWICPSPSPCPNIGHTLLDSASFAHDFMYMYNHYRSY